MIQFENLEKSFGARVLFSDVNFQINTKERVGLVGRNGHGKSTLLRMVTGEETIETGQIVFPKNYRIGYLAQQLIFTEDTVLDECALGLPPTQQGHTWEVEKILAGLGFSEADMLAHPSSFSGGFQVRINLAKVLVSAPDMLLLDEPTNYLDITSIRWMERFLKEWRGEMMLVTHDRSFMDRVVTHTVGIHRNRLKKIKGDTEKYYNQIAQEEEIYEKTRLNEEKKRKDVEAFITRFRAKATLASMVQSRVKALERQGSKIKLDDIPELEFSFRSLPFAAKQVVQVKDLTFGYDEDHPLIKNFSITVQPNDRICVIGQNGKGKTTLLKLLAESVSAKEGEIQYHPLIKMAVYEQTNLKTLVDDRTVSDEIQYAAPDIPVSQARSICGAMMFEQDNALKKISVLSGGEKSRVMLGKILATPANLLILDEPTNHLDMNACDALLSAVVHFDGTLIMVTHNELFLHAIANRLIVFKDDEVFNFDGTYKEFLDTVGWDESDGGVSKHGGTHDSSSSSQSDEQDHKLSKKERRKLRSEIITRRAKETKPLEKKIAAIEDGIDKAETDLAQHQEAMQVAAESQNGDQISELSQKIYACESKIETDFDTLTELSESLESIVKKYDEEMVRAGLFEEE